jgi:hypothetical protein
MKLLLKRQGDKSPMVDDAHSTGADRMDFRPLTLHTEDGEPLPSQKSVIMNSGPEGSTVTVTFFLDGKDVVVVGD